MESVTLTDARSLLDMLIDRVEAGDSIDITRDGRAVARLTAIAEPRRPVDLASLRRLSATMPLQAETAADLVRSMRDGDRN